MAPADLLSAGARLRKKRLRTFGLFGRIRRKIWKRTGKDKREICGPGRCKRPESPGKETKTETGRIGSGTEGIFRKIPARAVEKKERILGINFMKNGKRRSKGKL